MPSAVSCTPRSWHPGKQGGGGITVGIVADLLALSARIIDSGAADEPTNRVTQELSEVADGIAVVESFSHVVAVDTGDGLVCFDTSGPREGGDCVTALRGWSDEPVDSIVYTHGHLDHVGGSGAFVAEARSRGRRDPDVVAHAALPDRFDRYRATDGWNRAINARQFGGINPSHRLGVGGQGRFLPDDVAPPNRIVVDRSSLRVGNLLIELRHGRGETDDHLWAWLPEHRAICVGDFVTWVFPNAGNPQKVQRYPGEWAAALREMAALGPELMLPAHGLPVGGRDRVATILDDLASALEGLVADTVAMMNDGATLDEIVHTVAVDADLLGRPWLKPVYDEPEFVVRNIWRLYGGWWDGAAARLKPAPDAALGAEMARLAGGVGALVTRARELADEGDLRLACHLADAAVLAEPDHTEAHGARAEIYGARRRAESSLMAKGIYAAAARQSQQAAGAQPG